MRKFILLMCCLAFVAMPFGSLLAGDADDCNFLKDKDDPAYQPGLYGICVAWYNASNNGNELAADRLETKFFEASGLTLPLTDGGGYPDFECPCWSALSMDYICALGEGTPKLTQAYPLSEGFEDVYQGGLFFYGLTFAETEIFGVSVEDETCTYAVGTSWLTEIITSDEALTCGFEIGQIRDLHLTEYCPNL